MLGSAELKMFSVSVCFSPSLSPGISAAPISLVVFGDRDWRYFCICGQALHEVCEAHELANPGDVVLSATSWELCEQHRLRTKHLAGKRAVKVGGWDGVSSHCEDLGLDMKEGGVRRLRRRTWREL